MKKLLMFLRKTAAIFLTMTGILLTWTGICLFVPALLGKLGESWLQRLAMAGFCLLLIFASVKLMFLGNRWYPGKKKPAPKPKTSAAVPAAAPSKAPVAAPAEQETKQEEQCEYSPEVLPRDIPPLDRALESGNAGYGTRERHGVPGYICVTMQGTPRVKYYYFADGTLVFVGMGDTRTVDPGGHDGRNTYEQESPPWSQTVCEGTRRAVFTEGITSVGSGLLESLRNLEVLELADSVRTVEHNTIRTLRVLRAGKHFSAFNGNAGPLTELVLPEGSVHFSHYNGGSVPGVTGATPDIRNLLDRHLVLEFRSAMDELFRSCPAVAEKLYSLAELDKPFAAGTISSLNWNSKYKSTRYVPESDLWAQHGLTKNDCGGGQTISIDLKSGYGLHSFVHLAAMAHAALMAKPTKLVCSVEYLYIEMANAAKWWRREFPDTTLELTRKTGERILVKKPVLSDCRPSRQEMREIKNTLSEEESKRMSQRFYQYTQDVQRGGMDREIAAANRGLIWLEDGVADPELLEIARRQLETDPNPFRRAVRPYETAESGRQSLPEEEGKHLLFLSQAALTDKPGPGQREYFAVDTRSMTPYYIIEQEGPAARSRYEVKEPVTWAELERYGDPAMKTVLGHSNATKWSQWLAVFKDRNSGCLTLRWRIPGGIREAVLHAKATGYVLSCCDAAGKPKEHRFSREMLKEEILQEKTELPFHICKMFCSDGKRLTSPKQ